MFVGSFNRVACLRPISPSPRSGEGQFLEGTASAGCRRRLRPGGAALCEHLGGKLNLAKHRDLRPEPSSRWQSRHITFHNSVRCEVLPHARCGQSCSLSPHRLTGVEVGAGWIHLCYALWTGVRVGMRSNILKVHLN